MARRRRKNYRKRSRTRPAPARNITLVLIALTAFAAFGWLWLANRSDLTSARIKQLEQQKAQLSRQVANEESRWGILISYENISKLLKAHGLQMDWPKEAQIVRVQRTASGNANGDSLVRN